jgi:hypothetical protein
MLGCLHTFLGPPLGEFRQHLATQLHRLRCGTNTQLSTAAIQQSVTNATLLWAHFSCMVEPHVEPFVRPHCRRQRICSVPTHSQDSFTDLCQNLPVNWLVLT